LGTTTIAAFALQDGTGTPTRLGPDLPVGGANSPTTMALTPSTTGVIYVGVDNGGVDGIINAFRMQADGSLVAISDPSFPVAVPSGNDRFRVVLNPTGDQLYVPLALDGTIRRYQVENDGTLTFIDSVASGSARIWDLEFMPNLPFAYGSNVESSSLSIFSVAPNGALTFLSNFTLNFGPTVTGNIRPFDLKAHPTLPILYGDNSTTSGSQDDTLAVYSVNQTDGTLTLLEIERPGRGMSDLFMDPMAEYLYTTAGTDDLVSYSINADGTLENVETFELNPANNTNTFGPGREGATSTNTLLRNLDPNSRE
jgi:6-phosphogluconolactonase (cycloisomerase 2 family)